MTRMKSRGGKWVDGSNGKEENIFSFWQNWKRQSILLSGFVHCSMFSAMNDMTILHAFDESCPSHQNKESKKFTLSEIAQSIILTLILGWLKDLKWW